MAISDKITSIQNHLKDDWDSVESLIGDTELDKNIENISSALDDLYNDLPKVTGSGTSITLDDTRKGKIKSTLKGNTSQTTYSGKNKLDLTGITARTLQAGITITPNFEGNLLKNIKISGTPTTSAWQTLKRITLPAGSYIMTGINISQTTKTGLRIGVYIDSARQYFINANSTSYSFTLEEETSMDFVVWVQNVDFYPTGDVYVTPMIRLSSVSDATYEPYTNGASPNPSYPQPVNVVSGDNEINVVGKNLNKTSITVNLTSGNEKWTGVRLSEVNWVSGTTYYIKAFLDKQSNEAVQISNYGYMRIDESSVKTITYNGTPPYVRVGANTLNSNITNEEVKIMVSTETFTDFEAYSGDTYNIDLRIGKNLFDINAIVKGYELNSNTGKNQENADWWLSDYIAIKPNTEYTSSNISSNTKCWYDKYKNFISRVQSVTGTSPANAKYLRVNGTLASLESNPQAQIEEGNSVTIFEAYNSIELCKIGNYQDYFYKDSGKWYLHKEIGKVVLNGSESWFAETQRYRVDNIIQGKTFTSFDGNNPLAYCEGFKWGNGTSSNFVYGAFWYTSNGLNLSLQKDENPNATTLANFKTWLGSNNQNVRYILATPTNTKITYEPLLEQLEAYYHAKSRATQTNISQVNNDLPFIISASALKEWQESTSLNSTLSMVNPLSLGNTLNTQENNTQPIEVDNIEPLEEEENEES